MLHILRNTLATRRTRSLDDWVRLVVERTLAELEGSLDVAVQTMSAPEARGYVRARARRVVQKHVALLACEVQGLSPRIEAALCTKALEQVAHKSVRAIRSCSQSQLGRRRAA